MPTNLTYYLDLYFVYSYNDYLLLLPITLDYYCVYTDICIRIDMMLQNDPIFQKTFGKLL